MKLNLNIFKRADWTPLMMAALRKNSFKVIKLLVEAGGDIKPRNKDGWTVLNIASRTNDIKTFEYLLSLDKSGREIQINLWGPYQTENFCLG